MQFWVFQTETPDKPLVYMPSFDAILVPGQEYTPHTLPIMQSLAGVVPLQPPRRRRPILAVIDLLQKRYSQIENKKQTEDKNEDDKIKPVDNSQNSSEASDSIPKSDESSRKESSVCVEEDLTKEEVKDDNQNVPDAAVGNSEINATNTEEEKTNAPKLTKIYSLLDNLMKSHPNVNDGFSYAYKYSVPNSPIKPDEVEVSVQQSLKHFPAIPDEPLQNQFVKIPLDYKKAQAKLDVILEDSTKTGGPIHLNTPGAFGPLLLSQYAQEQADANEESSDTVDAVVLETTDSKSDNDQKTTKLLLHPVAKAVAGPRGIAVASPIAKAFLRRGQNVELDYDPDAVAIAGPGGRAHAHPQFSIDYLDSK